MPEIGEVARVVHYLRKHLLGKTFVKVTASADDIVYGKVGTSGPAVEKHLKGNKVVDVGQQGKYFWMILAKRPHIVMHLGMSGWIKFKNEHTYYYGTKDREAGDSWPPKYVKFHVETDGKGEDKVEAAFVDARRLARIRLVDCDGKEIRNNSPLKENGPDPVIDKDIFTLDWLMEKCKKKKVPIKAMLLDQANISGIGNWVGDEIMYHAKIHPEQYSNTLQDDQIKQLHESIKFVCGTAVDLLSDSTKFPEEWLFKHRWGKGRRKTPPKLPNGAKIVYLTVGGRTSAVVPSVQKKTGPVAAEMSEAEDPAELDDEEEEKPKKSKSKKRKAEAEEDDDVKEKVAPPKRAARGKKVKIEDVEPEEAPATNGMTKAKRATKSRAKAEEIKTEASPKQAVKPKTKSKTKKAEAIADKSAEDKGTGRRRSSRNK